MFSLSSKWLKELQEYSQVLVKEEMFLSRVETIQEEINILKTKRLENGFSLINQLRNDLKKVKTKNICIFAGGGIDSNLLILLCNEILNNKEISIFSIQTKDNRNDISQLRNLSKILKINHHIFRLEENDINDSLNYFFQKNKRYPRDEAYPGIFKLVNEGAKRFKDTTFMDGQYADTYTFSNPQNIYQIIWRFLPSIKINKIGYMRKSNKIVSLILGLFTTKVEFILYFCRIEDTLKTRIAISELINNCIVDFEIFFQIIFKEVLLFYREADKYKVPYKILSPFKNEELFIHACFNKKVYRSLFKKKKPIYGYIQKKYSNLKIKSYSKSFNIRSSLEDMKIN